MKLFLISCFALFYFESYTLASAQISDSTKADSVQKPRENWYWASYGAGVLFSGNTPTEIGVSVALSSILITAKSCNRLNYADGPSIGESGIMCGLISRGDWTFASVIVGVASTSVFNPWSATSQRSISVIGEAQIGLKAYFLGISFKIYGNWNTLAPSITGMLAIHLGWMP